MTKECNYTRSTALRDGADAAAVDEAFVNVESSIGRQAVTEDGKTEPRLYCKHCPALFNTAWEREEHEREHHAAPVNASRSGEDARISQPVLDAHTHFVLDCDDVLLDWMGGFRTWLHGNTMLAVPDTNPTSWNLDEWLGVPSMLLIERFNASKNFEFLNPMPGVRDAIKALKENGHHFTVLTSCSGDPAVAIRRRRNLAAYFGDAFDRVICLGLGETKASWLSALRPGIWIEDNYKNALCGVNAGHETFMLRRCHNRADEKMTDERITWLDDLRPVVSMFAG